MKRTWQIFSSPRTGALLALLFALLPLVAVLVPQGSNAKDELLSGRLIPLAVFGITDLLYSPWFFVLAILLLGNLVAMGVRYLARSSPAHPPSSGPHHATVERGVEDHLEPFASEITIDGEVTTMETGSPFARLLIQSGLILVAVSALFLVTPTKERNLVTRAILDIQDLQSKTVGRFDMVEGESFQLFQYPDRYRIIGYNPDREGMGPAVLFERGMRQREQFWIYRSAPEGFDARHRAGKVAFTAKRIDREPLPGTGLSASWAAILMVMAVGILGLGGWLARVPRGRIWLIENPEEGLEVIGVPFVAGDSRFARYFDRFVDSISSI